MKAFGFLSHIDDFVNAIAVKEMRQAVKGRTIAWVLMLFLIVQLLIIGVVVMTQDEIGNDFDAGKSVFMGMLGVLLGTCLLFIPAITAFRLSSERGDNNVDLLFITTLKPMQIIWCKLSAAMVLIVLFFSASMPFMTLTYLLRGLDLPSMFILLGMDFLIVIACVQFAILLASAPGGIISKGLRFLFGLAVLIGALISSLMMSWGMLYSGIGSMLGTWEFWGIALTNVISGLLVVGLMFVLSVTIITPRSANKAVAVRIYLFFLWLAHGTIVGVWYYHVRDKDVVISWTLSMVIMFIVTLLVAVCERLSWGPRIVTKIPRNVLLRIPAFLIYSGASCGVVFSVTMIGVTLAIGYVFGVNVSMNRDYEFMMMISVGLALYTFCYAMTSLLIKRMFFAKSTRASTTGIIAIFLLLATTVIPWIIGVMMPGTRWYDISPRWYIANPIVIFWDGLFWGNRSHGIQDEGLVFTSVWAMIILVLSVPWFVRQMVGFKPAAEINVEAIEGSDE